MFGKDRMLAIFYVIADMQSNNNADILTQISTLVSLGVLFQGETQQALYLVSTLPISNATLAWTSSDSCPKMSASRYTTTCTTCKVNN